MTTLATKLLNVQKKIGTLKKTSSNPYFNSKYAELNQVLGLAKEALNAEGICIIQAPGLSEHGKFLKTILTDAESGTSISSEVPFSGFENDMQKIGAAITYARRFGLVSLLALESEDDDGEAAVGRSVVANKSESRPKVETKTQAPAAPVRASLGPKANPGPTRVGGDQGEPKKTLPTGVSSKTTLEKIGLTSKILVDSKRTTQEYVMGLLTVFGVKTKEELKPEQATKLLAQLEEKLNG